MSAPVAEHVNETAERYWEMEQPIFAKVREQGFEEYARSLGGLEQAFARPDRRVVCCIDEGTDGSCLQAAFGGQNPEVKYGSLNAPGSLILNEDEEAERFSRMGEVDGFTSHVNCGAAKLDYYRLHGLPEDAEVSWAEIDRHAEEMAKEKAARCGKPYLGQLTAEQMTRPSDSHVARVVYYVGTEDFDPNQVAGLPDGFIVSRRFLSKDAALEAAAIGVSIGTGDHGYGPLLSPSEPFYLVAVGNPVDEGFSYGDLLMELNELAAKSGSKVTADGFVAPAGEDVEF